MRGFSDVPSILKFFRITFFLVLYFFLCMVVVTTMLQGWPVGAQMLFAFGVPVILVWWQEKRRSRKVAAKAQAEASSETRTSRPEPVARPSAYDKRIEREHERTREANASKAPAAVQAYSPPKQDYDEIVRAGKSAAPVLAVAAERNQPLRAVSSTSARSTKSGWVPYGETASVAHRNIGGMVYVGTPPLLNIHG
ncbi:hypothetical protein [Roseovarius sp. D0-M9]|uniref:hypothetical protein n=1 Tax=Roseovarius sp. D0-M9 TaxID=3127117 RepID=UPI00300FF2EF